MKLRTAICIVAVGLSVLACGGSTSTEVAVPEVEGVPSVGGATLQAPWDSMGFPGDQTSIAFQNETTITMDVPGEPAEVGKKYDAAVTAAGWSASAPFTEMGGTGGGVYSKDGKTLSLAVSKSFTGGSGSNVSISIN